MERINTSSQRASDGLYRTVARSHAGSGSDSQTDTLPELALACHVGSGPAM